MVISPRKFLFDLDFSGLVGHKITAHWQFQPSEEYKLIFFYNSNNNCNYTVPLIKYIKSFRLIYTTIVHLLLNSMIDSLEYLTVLLEYLVLHATIIQYDSTV